MAAKYIIPIAVCFFLSLANVEGLQTVDGKIKITVGTTAGCGDTVRFIEDLVETYEVYKDFLDIEFIPWGRTIYFYENGTWYCQFGENNCWSNRVQRCVLNMLPGNQEAQLHYMSCEFTTPYPSFLQGSYICAHAVGLSLVEVDNCVTRGYDQLDTEASIIGTEMTDVLDFVPAIKFNDIIDREEHEQALVRLKSMICFALSENPETGVTNCPF